MTPLSMMPVGMAASPLNSRLEALWQWWTVHVRQTAQTAEVDGNRAHWSRHHNAMRKYGNLAFLLQCMQQAAVMRSDDEALALYEAVLKVCTLARLSFLLTASLAPARSLFEYRREIPHQSRA